jgi:amino acid adenylation domain-containing protein
LFNAAVKQAVIDTEAFRVRFVEEIDGPQQVIDPLSEISLPLFDVSAELDPRAAAEAWMKADLAKPIDLLHSPLFCFALFRAAPDRFFWYQRAPHIVMDGFGGALFARRVADVYTSLVNKLPCSANPFGSLRLLVEEDASYRASERFTRDRQYWLESLTDRLEPVSLSRRPPISCSRVLRQTAYLPASSAETLRSVARRAGAGLAQIIVAATALYLHRLTSAQDLVLSLPVTGRLGAVSRRTPGMLSNVLPLRLKIQPGMSLTELVEYVAQQIRRALLHQRYRIEDLLRDLGLLAHDQKLFGISVNVMPFDYDLRFAGHRATTHNLSNGPVDDLWIAVYDQSDSNGVRIDFDANQALYSIDGLANHQQRFLRLLGTIAADLSQSVGRVELLASEERRQLLVEWNATARDLAQVTLPAFFEAQVERSPEAIALIFEESTLSYGELNAQANRLAHLLIGRGIGPEKLVALALPRSAEVIIALLATLKAGAAYLPLDPDYPVQRLAHMLQDAQPACVLTTAQIAACLPDKPRRLILEKADTLSALDRSLVTNPTDTERTQPLSPQHLAYVIYTSGSTGEPKGVLVHHGALINFLRWLQTVYPVQTDDAYVLKTNYTFDVSTTELFGWFLAQGKLIIIPPGEERNPSSILELIDRNAVSHVNFTPSALSSFLESQIDRAGAQTKSLKYLMVAGEEFSLSLEQKLQSFGGLTQIENLYGPTEATVYALRYSLSERGCQQLVPVGRPISSTQAYVLDANLQPMPVGVPGELYVAGAGLARGYLKRPALSAERFVADPYGTSGTRMYRTGDLARWRAEGVLELLGRTDQQLKIRGFRIEPGEIEAVLKTHERVRDALVTIHGQADQKQLLGYAIGRQGEAQQAQAQASQVSHWQQLWQQLYESTYTQGPASYSDFNIVGWNSSYTGEPVPAQEMRLWVEETVAHLRALEANRVLEIGCGTGLLLTRLAPSCESYLGLDFSTQVLVQLGAYLATRQELGHVVLRQGPAHELSFLGDDSVDLVILNSVVQYFPDIDSRGVCPEDLVDAERWFSFRRALEKRLLILPLTGSS